MWDGGWEQVFFRKVFLQFNCHATESSSSVNILREFYGHFSRSLVV